MHKFLYTCILLFFFLIFISRNSSADSFSARTFIIEKEKVSKEFQAIFNRVHQNARFSPGSSEFINDLCKMTPYCRTNPEFFDKTAICYWLYGDYYTAIEILEYAYQINPQYLVNSNLINFLEKTGQRGKAYYYKEKLAFTDTQTELSKSEHKHYTEQKTLYEKNCLDSHEIFEAAVNNNDEAMLEKLINSIDTHTKQLECAYMLKLLTDNYYYDRKKNLCELLYYRLSHFNLKNDPLITLYYINYLLQSGNLKYARQLCNSLLPENPYSDLCNALTAISENDFTSAEEYLAKNKMPENDLWMIAYAKTQIHLETPEKVVTVISDFLSVQTYSRIAFLLNYADYTETGKKIYQKVNCSVIPDVQITKNGNSLYEKLIHKINCLLFLIGVGFPFFYGMRQKKRRPIEFFDKKTAYCNTEMAIILAVTVIAAGIRIFYAMYCDYTFDERLAFSYAASSDLKTFFNIFLYDENHPVLYFLLTYGIVKFFGCAAMVFKSVNLFFGIASIPAYYFLSRKLMSKKASFLGMIIMSFAPFVVYFSKDGRFYSMVLFFVILNYSAFISLIRTGFSSSKSKVIWVLSGIIFIHTFYFSVFAFVAEFLFMVVWCRTANFWKCWIKMLIPIILSIVPWLLMVKGSLFNTNVLQHLNQHFNQRMVFRDFSDILYTIYNSIQFPDGINNRFAVMILIIIASCGLRKLCSSKAKYILCLALTPVICLIMVTLFSQYWKSFSFYSVKYAITGVPGIILLLSYCIFESTRILKKIEILLLLVYLVVDLPNTFYDAVHYSVFAENDKIIQNCRGNGIILNIYSVEYGEFPAEFLKYSQPCKLYRISEDDIELKSSELASSLTSNYKNIIITSSCSLYRKPEDENYGYDATYRLKKILQNQGYIIIFENTNLYYCTIVLRKEIGEDAKSPQFELHNNWIVYSYFFDAPHLQIAKPFLKQYQTLIDEDDLKRFIKRNDDFGLSMIQCSGKIEFLQGKDSWMKKILESPYSSIISDRFTGKVRYFPFPQVYINNMDYSYKYVLPLYSDPLLLFLADNLVFILMCICTGVLLLNKIKQLYRKCKVVK